MKEHGAFAPCLSFFSQNQLTCLVAVIPVVSEIPMRMTRLDDDRRGLRVNTSRFANHRRRQIDRVSGSAHDRTMTLDDHRRRRRVADHHVREWRQRQVQVDADACL